MSTRSMRLRPKHVAVFGLAAFVLGLGLAYWFVGAAVLNTPVCGVLYPPPGCRTITYGVCAALATLASAPIAWIVALVWAVIDLRKPIDPRSRQT